MKPIIFFDGVCNLCNRFIDFVVRHDREKKYFIASLQGKTAAQLLSSQDLKTLSSIVLLEGENLYYKSEAVIRIISGLGGAWNGFNVLKLFPLGLRDYAYELTAKNRYRLFGKRDSCRLPDPEEKTRFLE